MKSGKMCQVTHTSDTRMTKGAAGNNEVDSQAEKANSLGDSAASREGGTLFMQMNYTRSRSLRDGSVRKNNVPIS